MSNPSKVTFWQKSSSRRGMCYWVQMDQKQAMCKATSQNWIGTVLFITFHFLFNISMGILKLDHCCSHGIKRTSSLLQFDLCFFKIVQSRPLFHVLKLLFLSTLLLLINLKSYSPLSSFLSFLQPNQVTNYHLLQYYMPTLYNSPVSCSLHFIMSWWSCPLQTWTHSSFYFSC